MRSEQVHTAIFGGHTRFQICQRVSEGVRIMHRNGTRMADSIGTVFDHLAIHTCDPAPRRPSPESTAAFDTPRSH